MHLAFGYNECLGGLDVIMLLNINACAGLKNFQPQERRESNGKRTGIVLSFCCMFALTITITQK